MRVSVVIVNYNVCDLLLSAIESLGLALSGIDSEIIVVDNASSDGAVETLNRLYPDVTTIGLDRNLGFAAANNIGIERASGEFILILNPDTIVQEDTVRTMIEFMEEHPRAVFAGCRIILPDGTLDPVSKRGFPSPWSSFCRIFGLSRIFPNSRLFGEYNLTYLDNDRTTRVDALCGCFMFCRAVVLRGLGGFDTDYFMYGEDLDLCYRATKEGGEIYYHPATSILHRKGESTRRSSLDTLAVFYEAMEIFARKHFRRNPLLLALVRVGIHFRRGVARLNEHLPGIAMLPVDVVAILSGFVLGSVLKFGSPFYYPDPALPIVWGLPPLLFVLALALVGGYRRDDHTPARAILGYLLGFFVLSTLPYFFKSYAFSRGVVLVTTGVGLTVGVAARFLWLLYRRIYGAEAIRRIAILGRAPASADTRASIRRMFLARPVIFAGTIAPTVAEEWSEGVHFLGSAETIERIVREHRITDVVVIDNGLSYSDVLRAMGLVSAQTVRFHVLNAASNVAGTQHREAPHATRIAVALLARPASGTPMRDRLLALVIVTFLWPVVYLTAHNPHYWIGGLLRVVVGHERLVGSGGMAILAGGRPPLFSMTHLFDGGELSTNELGQLDDFYQENRSLLLDCEIITTVLRQSQTHREPMPSESGKIGRATTDQN